MWERECSPISITGSTRPALSSSYVQACVGGPREGPDVEHGPDAGGFGGHEHLGCGGASGRAAVPHIAPTLRFWTLSRVLGHGVSRTVFVDQHPRDLATNRGVLLPSVVKQSSSGTCSSRRDRPAAQRLSGLRVGTAPCRQYASRERAHIGPGVGRGLIFRDRGFGSCACVSFRSGGAAPVARRDAHFGADRGGASSHRLVARRAESVGVYKDDRPRATVQVRLTGYAVTPDDR